MSVLKQALFRMSGSQWAQGLLERNARFSQYFMGVGSGAGVFSSGERVVFDLLRETAAAPYCIFDVGANRGQFLSLARKSLADAGYRIHCFEPGRETFAMLRAAAPPDEHIHLENLGLGREPGQLTLHYDRAGSGLASLTRRKLDHFGIDFSQSEDVQIETIDRYRAHHGLARIHLLKIDVEGHELDVLAGARDSLAAGAIDIVAFEFGGCNIDTRTYFRDFWYLFRDAGMKLYRIAPPGLLRPVPAYNELLERFLTTNYVAVKEMGTLPIC